MFCGMNLFQYRSERQAEDARTISSYVPVLRPRNLTILNHGALNVVKDPMGSTHANVPLASGV